MAKKLKLPLVAICGRPNVGKSTLFNRITGKARAIVHNQEGITRDRFFGEGEWGGRRFRIVDTGGIVENPVDNITRQMQDQVDAALDDASVIVFVVDGQTELTRVDQEVVQVLHKKGKPVVLAVNKLDNPEMTMNRYDFFSLGLGEPYAVSSGHGTGVDDLMHAVLEELPPPGEMPEEEPEETAIRVAVVGKPNVGKSSFINAILNEPRVIVDDTPGTTRDAIDINFRWKDKEYLFIDTAGLRKKAGIKEKVEHFSVSRSLRAVRRADICLIMIDAVEEMSEQDKRIIGYCQENGTAMILVWTKWDLVEDKAARFKDITDELDFKMGNIKYVPYITISNVTRQRIFTTFDFIDRVVAESERRVDTAELNRFIDEVKAKHNPPSYKGKHANIKYITQVGTKPTTFVLFVNQKSLFHFSYMRYLENQLRERYGFEGVPLKLELREGKPKS
jgi:GTP-binding protein